MLTVLRPAAAACRHPLLAIHPIDSAPLPLLPRPMLSTQAATWIVFAQDGDMLYWIFQQFVSVHQRTCTEPTAASES